MYKHNRIQCKYRKYRFVGNAAGSSVRIAALQIGQVWHCKNINNDSKENDNDKFNRNALFP